LILKPFKGHIKGLVHPKLKMIPLFTKPQGILIVFDFLLSAKHNILALPRFIMGVFEAPKSTAIHHKSNPKGTRGLKKAL